MLTLPVWSLAEITGGEIIVGSADTMANGLKIDSRQIEPGNVFVAFEGSNTDGHNYLEQAISLGARVLLVTRTDDRLEAVVEHASRRLVTVVRVTDALSAVQALAKYHRSRLFCPVIGVTGSTGKTTTKDFITSVLSRVARVVATEGNRNNELGVPLTLFDAGVDTDVAVLEMAMRGPGQIRALAEIARPTAGLITNIGTSHIEFLGSQDAIADAKAELVDAITEQGVVFLNGDDEYTDKIASSAIATVVRYGLRPGNDIRAEQISLNDKSQATFSIVTDDSAVSVSLGLPGRHNVYNALAAAAVGIHLGMSLEEIAAGLQDALVTGMRMQAFVTAGGVHVINDAYNASPASMRAAIATLSGISLADRRVAVLGDMAELGSLTELAHFRIGEEIARLRIDYLITIGDRAKRIADGAKAEGMGPSRVMSFEAVDDASRKLKELLQPRDAVLVKASRVMGLEKIVEELVSPSD